MVKDVQRSIYNGRKLKLEIFGASHAPEIGVKASGLKGKEFSIKELQEFLDRRKPKNTAYSTKRLEGDKVEFIKGVRDEKIKGDFVAVIKNQVQNSKDYSNLIKTPRPAHADYVAYLPELCC